MIARTCPTHKDARLFGGPVHFTCMRGHGVQAAELSNEFQPRPTPAPTPARTGRA